MTNALGENVKTIEIYLMYIIILTTLLQNAHIYYVLFDASIGNFFKLSMRKRFLSYSPIQIPLSGHFEIIIQFVQSGGGIFEVHFLGSKIVKITCLRKGIQLLSNAIKLSFKLLNKSKVSY